MGSDLLSSMLETIGFVRKVGWDLPEALAERYEWSEHSSDRQVFTFCSIMLFLLASGEIFNL